MAGSELRVARRPKHESLFARSAPAVSRDAVVATIDGAARGNPGPAAYGVVFEDASGKVLARLSGRLGRTTNNVAEYRALLAALAYASERHWRALRVRTDSELLARQFQGDYRVKSTDLKPLYREAQQLIAALDSFSVEAVPRKLTRAADKLANAALDKRAAISAQRAESESRFARRPAKIQAPRRVAPTTPRTVVRAVYEAGVLKPLNKLELADGEEVELIVRRRQ